MIPLRFSLVTDKPNNMYIHNSYIHDELITDFQSFAAPENFTKPSQFADFGLSLNIYQIYKDYSNPNKKLIYEFTSEIATLTLPVVANVTYRYGETISGVDYVTDVASGTAFTEGSTKRYVIVNSTVTPYILILTIPVGAVWIYIGKNTTRFTTGNNSYCKYIFFEDLISLSIIDNQQCDSCSQLTGTLTIPNSITNKKLGHYAFRNNNSINKVIIPESITNLGVITFQGSAAIIGRHYYIYCTVAPITNSSFNARSTILHIKSGATGYDVAPWNDPAYFSQTIEDL